MPLPRVVIFHGAHGAPDTNWFPWLDAQLTRRGFEVLRPRFPTPQGQSLSAWLEVSDAALATPSEEGMILVGHSLGAAMALRVVERTSVPCHGLFLAAGFLGALGLPDYDPINASFFASPFDWTAIRNRARVRACWAGDDDPYVPLRRSEILAAQLHVPLQVIARGGHLNAESDVVTFPQIEDAIVSAANVSAGAMRG